MRQIKSLDQFLEAGGVVTTYPPEEANPKKHEYVRITKEKRAAKVSNYERTRLPKGEALANKLNLGSQDWTNIAAGDRKNRITSEEIHAALAGCFTETEEAFLLYVYTGDRRYRSGAWATLMTRLAGDAVQGKWDLRKRGILTAAANTALENFLRPKDFEHLNHREWAKKLDLSCHKDWPKRWKPRYDNLMEFGYLLLDSGRDALARNF